MWLWIHRSNKSVQSFQMGVVRHAQNDRKQVTYISKMNLSMILIFCMWLGITTSALFHSYECDQAHMGMPKVIANITSVICQD